MSEQILKNMELHFRSFTHREEYYLKKRFTGIAAGLLMVSCLTACGNENTSVKITKAAYTKKDPYVGVWASTAWSLEQNVTLEITKNKDQTYHFVYQKDGVKKEADYISEEESSGSYSFIPKSNKSVFNGEVGAIEDDFTPGNWSIGVTFNNGNKGQPDVFAKLGSAAVYIGNWVSTPASLDDYYILRILNFGTPTYHVELDHFEQSNVIVTQDGEYMVSKDQKMLLLKSKKGPFTTIHLTKDKDGNLQVKGFGNPNDHEKNMVFKVQT